VRAVGLETIGTDSRGDVYFLARLARGGEDGPLTPYAFVLSGANGSEMARLELRALPDMLTTRYLTVSGSGYVYYMRRNRKDRTIEFYRI
jgi:hypothetical protein